jgi:hypothetical protein
MQNIKTELISTSKIITLTKLSILIGIATTAPLLKNQFITGPIVNATLYLATMNLGITEGVWVGLLPSLIALSAGLLPTPLAPMIPFIMTGNALLVTAFGKLKRVNYWLAAGIASVAKFTFLYITSTTLIKGLLAGMLATKAATMMSWPQLVTALLGALLAFTFNKVFTKS